MTVYSVINQTKLNELLPLLAHLSDDMKLEVAGLNIGAETKGELRTAQSLPFPLLMQVPRKSYPGSAVKIEPAD